MQNNTLQQWVFLGIGLFNVVMLFHLFSSIAGSGALTMLHRGDLLGISAAVLFAASIALTFRNLSEVVTCYEQGELTAATVGKLGRWSIVLSFVYMTYIILDGYLLLQLYGTY